MCLLLLFVVSWQNEIRLFFLDWTVCNLNMTPTCKHWSLRRDRAAVRPAAGLQKYKHKVKHDRWAGEVPLPWARCCFLWTAVVKCSHSPRKIPDKLETNKLVQLHLLLPAETGRNKSWHKCCYRICPWKLLEKQEIPLRFQAQSSKSPNSLKSRASKKNTTTSSSSPPHFLPRWRRAARYRHLPAGRRTAPPVRRVVRDL